MSTFMYRVQIIGTPQAASTLGFRTVELAVSS